MKQDLIQRKEQLLKELEQIELELKKPTPELMFCELMKGVDLMPHNPDYPDSVFLFKGEFFFMKYNTKNKYLWCSYSHIWKVFEDEFGMKYEDIQSLIKKVVEQSFKLQGVTPNTSWLVSYTWWNSHSNCRE